ncbi:MAG: ABC transporter ATP-binding protein [Thaumarchaeota archaeon]|nr:ABC transporter ATP-binding protein [Nitrososphaerota archaeon]MCL5317409.1 ABC transporter ATP-binding protein [Nitrososphaerota archaeon]
MSEPEYPLSTQGLVKRYSSYTAVGPVSLNIEEGWIFGFLGPNGAGKTTTIRMILGLIRPNEGSVKILGADPFKNPEKALSSVGYAAELPNFQTFFTGEALLDFTGKLHGMSSSARKRRSKDLIDMVGLGDHARKKIGKYSKGMVQRLSVAQALMNDPKILIMDEPTLGMDPAANIYFRDLFKKLAGEGRTLFISSHQLDEVQRLSTHVGMINRGQIVFQGTTDSVLSAFAKEFLIEVELEMMDSNVVENIRNLGYVKNVEVATGKLYVTLNEKKDLRADLAEDIIRSGGRLQGLSLHKASLEEAFIETLRKGE